MGEELAPGQRPAFLNPQTDESDLYPGEADTVTFDDEIAFPADVAVSAAGTASSVTAENDRVRRVAEYLALGVKIRDIAYKMQYSVGGIHTLKKNPRFKPILEQARERVKNYDAAKIMKELALPAAMRIRDRVLDPDSKNGDELARFTVEQSIGKATPQAPTSDGTTLSQLIEAIQTGKIQVAAAAQRDVTPESAPIEVTARNKWDVWLDENP